MKWNNHHPKKYHAKFYDIDTGVVIEEGNYRNHRQIYNRWWEIMLQVGYVIGVAVTAVTIIFLLYLAYHYLINNQVLL